MCAAIVALVAGTALGPAFGQPGNEVGMQAKTAAEAAFRQAKDQLAAGDLDGACQSFHKSQELDPQLGTQYNLALCFEKAGRLASAWSIFSELAATDTNKGRRNDAAKRVKTIGPRLVRVLVVLRGDTPGLKLSRSGVDITAAIGVATPVDPGMGQVTAEAPGYRPWSAEVSMAGEGSTITVEVPALDKLPEDKPPEIVADPTPILVQPVPPPPPRVDNGNRRRVLGLVVAGVGVAAIGGGVVLGMSATSAYDDARTECGAEVSDCRGDLTVANDLVDQARSRALFSTIAVAVGGAAVVGGVVLYLAAPKHRERAVAVAPALGPDQAGVVVSGRF